jgi:hypothetical protein
MALPGNITTITLTGSYIDFTGTALAGQVKITMPQVLINATADTIIIPSTITAVLDANGAFSLTVPVSNDSDLDVYDNANDTFAYTFEESFLGGSTYSITLLSSLGASVDISDLRTTATVTNFIQPASANLFPALTARVAQEEEDLDDDPKLLAAPTYENLALFVDTYTDLASEYADYSEVDGTDLSPELNFTEARIQEIIDRIADLYDYTASVLELRDTTGTGFASGVLTNTAYQGLTAKWGIYSTFASSYATYAQAASGVTWTYAEIGALIDEIGEALTGTGTLTDNYLSITRTSVDGTYGAWGLQGETYADMASEYATYADSTGITFSFTYRDTADRLRDEANRINRLMLIGAE